MIIISKDFKMEIPKYCDIIDDESITIIRKLLTTPIKKYNNSKILYGELNPSIDYNQIVSKILEGFDNTMNSLIESTSENDKSEIAQKYLEDVFLKNGIIFDYIMTSGIFNKYAKLFNINECPISSVPKNQKIIIKDQRNVKTSTIDMKGISSYYTEVQPFS